MSNFFGKLRFLSGGEYSRDFAESIEFLKLDTTPQNVIAFSRAAMFLSAVILGIPLFYFFGFSGLIGAVILAFIGGQLITDYPKRKTIELRINALSEIPNIIVNLIISLRQKSNLEHAISFAGNYSEGPIAEDLKRLTWNHWTGKKSSINEQLDELALKWGVWSNGFKRAVYLIRSSLAEKSEARRLKTLDRALEVVLDDIKFQNRRYAEEMRTPTMILFSFGTVLPLVAISILPILSFIGIMSTSALQVFVLLVLSLVAVYFYSNSIMAKKPAGYSQIKIPKEKSKKSWAWYSLGIAIFLSFPGILYLIGQIPGVHTGIELSNDLYSLSIIIGIMTGISTYNHNASKDRIKERNKIAEMESELTDVTYQLGSRMGENRSPEEALRWVAKTMPDYKISELLKRVSQLIRKRSFTLEQAFFERNVGVLRKTHSKRIKSIFQIFINSGKKGVKASSEAMFSLSNQLGEIKKTNDRIQHNLTNSLSMMKLTATVFAPAICGLIISMQAIMNNTLSRASVNLSKYGYDIFVGSAKIIPIGILQLIVGVYLIALSYLLIRFVSIVKNSNDEILLKRDLSSNLVISLIVFIASLIISRGLV